MANPNARHPQERGGPWFVDTSCIDCDVARQLAPGLIGEAPDGNSHFLREPRTAEEVRLAWRALLACPTGSIGAPPGAKPPGDALPFEVAPGAFLLGFNSRSSFGANSWYVPPSGGRPGLMVDAPRWVERVAADLEARGGVGHVLLTHRDDVADYDRYAARLGARVWIHEADREAAPDATDTFREAMEIAPGVHALPVPGHTRGSACYLVDQRFLFTGDSLAWSRAAADLTAFGGATWFSWEEQVRSLERLAADVSFEWVLPGHGQWAHGSREEMARRLRDLVARMKKGRVRDEW